MANTNAPFGLKPFENTLRATWYPIATSYGTALFLGSAIQSAANPTGLVCAYFGGDTRLSVITSTTAAAGLFLGGALAFMDSSGNPIMYYPATTVGDGVVGGYVLVADHPDQKFVIQEDGLTTPIAVLLRPGHGPVLTFSQFTAKTGKEAG